MNSWNPLGGGLNSEVFHDGLFEKIISLENLFVAWREFKKGKGRKADVQEFEFDLEDNIFSLHESLRNKTYQHFDYIAFNVCDPKLRRIHKAIIRDRVLHHAIFRILYPVFDKNFIFDSYSCRVDKGTHRAVNRLEKLLLKASSNNHKNIYALKCDVRKFFDSINQEILLRIIEGKIKDENTLWLLKKIVGSFPSGLPLGNVTSQLFANIYLNELDQFAKHVLKIKYYLRYCDDVIVLNEDKNYLEELAIRFDEFLKNKLELSLHPNKIIIRKHKQGIDFLGYVAFPNHRILRIKTKKRIFRKIKEKKIELQDGLISKESFNQSLQSYLGILKHCNGHKIEEELKKIITQKL